jgi:hypothetical protein
LNKTRPRANRQTAHTKTHTGGGLPFFIVKQDNANKPQNKPTHARNTQSDQIHDQIRNKRNRAKRQAHKGKRQARHNNTSKRPKPQTVQRAKVRKMQEGNKPLSATFCENVEKAIKPFLRL